MQHACTGGRGGGGGQQVSIVEQILLCVVYNRLLSFTTRRVCFGGMTNKVQILPNLVSPTSFSLDYM